MTTLSPSSLTSPKQPEKSSRLARWSLWMAAAFVGVYLLTTLIGLYLVFPMLGLQEGDIFILTPPPQQGMMPRSQPGGLPIRVGA